MRINRERDDRLSREAVNTFETKEKAARHFVKAVDDIKPSLEATDPEAPVSRSGK